MNSYSYDQVQAPFGNSQTNVWNNFMACKLVANLGFIYVEAIYSIQLDEIYYIYAHGKSRIVNVYLKQ
jgi:hypothetical protein